MGTDAYKYNSYFDDESDILIADENSEEQNIAGNIDEFVVEKSDPKALIVSASYINHASTDFKKFNSLKNNWLDEVGFFSNPDILFSNKNYRDIIDMGFTAVPFLIDDLRKNEGDWFFALREILEVDPIQQEHHGDYDAMSKDWISWSASNLGI